MVLIHTHRGLLSGISLLESPLADTKFPLRSQPKELKILQTTSKSPWNRLWAKRRQVWLVPNSSACHQSHASLSVSTPIHSSHPAHTSCHPHSSRTPCTGTGPASSPHPRQSQLIRHVCWGFPSFITLKAAPVWLEPRHRKSELVFELARESLHEIREGHWASVSQLPTSNADTTAYPLIHPLSDASAFGDRGIFLCGSPGRSCPIALHQRWVADLCLHSFPQSIHFSRDRV